MGLGSADAMDVAQADFDPLLGWDIDAGNARHDASPYAARRLNLLTKPNARKPCPLDQFRAEAARLMEVESPQGRGL
jgi:hypothetical protein